MGSPASDLSKKISNMTKRDSQISAWNNWSGNQSCQPREFLFASTESDLAEIVAETRSCLRVVGAGHSFSPLIPTNDVLISVDEMGGLIEVDPEKHQALVWAGTPLRELGRLLWDAGLSISAQGDVDHQSLGGAVGTGTHGTGRRYGCMSSAVIGFRLLLADGTVIDCDAERNREIFLAGRVSLGSIGIMTQIRLQCEPAFWLRQTVRSMRLDECLELLDSLLAEHRHFEFFGFPYCDRVLLKAQDKTEERKIRTAVDFDDQIMWTFCQTARISSTISRCLQRLAMRFLPTSTTVAPAYEIYPSQRSVRFNETEYAVPIDQFVPCYRQLIQLVRDRRLKIVFPFECRWVAADDIWLSPFYGQDRVAISVHRHFKQPFREFFDLVERVFCEHNGRPHWGKLHHLGPKQLAELYPRWKDFIELRKRLDSTEKFLNPYLRSLLSA